MRENSLDRPDQTDIATMLRDHAERPPVILRELATNIGEFAGSDLADIAHYLCQLHGRYPGVMDSLSDRMIGSGDPFYSELADIFTSERKLLTDLTVAAGPLNRLVGEDRSMAVAEQLRVAIDLLARSDRDGCALGAAAALLSDWANVRPALTAMALRLAVPMEAFVIHDTLDDMQARICNTNCNRRQRAITFGMQQLWQQHAQFWLLLNNRCATRRSQSQY